MKKAFDQTFRDIKREVNKKVLKVPGVEQKVLDATSNEPWGPHGSHLADIAQATRNYHEYQMIMAILWKRINDTGKNWRHVYKALTVLEYLVAHGSERVIDEIKEHAYQISTLSDFQYIDSSGRDQGSNVRKKSQSLVALVNDKERVQEVRQKAASNREKFRGSSTTGGMHRAGSYSSTGGYDDDRSEGRYGSRDDDRNGYGREKEGGYRDDDRYGRYGDSNRDGDRYGRDSEERHGRDGYRDEGYRGRSRSIGEYQYGSRSRSSDRDRDRAYEDDGQYSARGSGAKADDQSQDGSYESKRLERKSPEQNIDAPPSYEEAVGDAPNQRDGETSAASIPKAPSPTVKASPKQATASVGSSGAPAPAPAPAPANKEVDGFDEFDPRGPFPGNPSTSVGADMDLLGSLVDEPFSSNSLAIVPTASEADATINSGSGSTVAATPPASTVTNQPFEDPFGDGPFRAIPSAADSAPPPPPPAQFQNFNAAAPSFHPDSATQSFNPPAEDTVNNNNNNYGFGDSYSAVSYTSSSNVQDPDQGFDILADILPPSGSMMIVPTGQTSFPAQSVQPTVSQMGYPSQSGQPVSYTSQTGQPASQTGFPHAGHPATMGSFPPQAGYPAPSAGYPTPSAGYPTPSAGYPAPSTGFPTSNAPQVNANFQGGMYSTPPNMAPPQQSGFAAPVSSSHDFHVQPTNTLYSQHSAPAGSLAIVPQPAKEKFEPKSSVWADTLNRGLVNFNISGPKTNPLSDIGIDFDAINRKEKRMEKPSAVPATSTITMGKAMGSGSGVGRAGAGALRPSANPMGMGHMGGGMGMGMNQPGMGMGMGMNQPGMGMMNQAGMGMGGGPPGGGYGGMNQPMGMGMGMGGGPGGGYGGMNQPMGGMGMGMGMGMGNNMGMGMNQPMAGQQGVNNMQQAPSGFPPGSNMPPGYNPMMGGAGGYPPQQHPYGGGGGYR